MNNPALVALLVVFLVHLVAFAVLGLRRREGYYLALVVTFALLSVSIGARLIAPDIALGNWPLHQLIRYTAWVAAAISITWTISRMRQRFRARQSGRQNCS